MVPSAPPRGRVRPAGDDDPHRIGVAQPKTAHVEPRIVRPRGAGSNEDRVGARAHQMHLGTRAGAGDPAAFARGGRDAPVERGGELERQTRPPGPDAPHEARVDLLRLGGETCGRHLDPGRPQRRETGARDPRIRILDGRDHPRDPGGDQRLGAGRRLADMGAGFQRHVSRRAARGRSGLRQSLRLRVRPPAIRRPAPTDDAALRDDHAAHCRIGPDPPQTAPGKPQRRAHVARVDVRQSHAVSRRPSRSRAAEARTRIPRNRRLPGSFCRRWRTARKPRCRSAPGSP